MKLLGVLLALALLLGGCAYTPADAYADFLSDSDLEMRFSICFDDVEKGRDTFYTRDELRSILRDLQDGYAVSSVQAGEATGLYEETARLLLDYLRSEERSAEVLAAAQTCFAAATQRANQIRGA